MKIVLFICIIVFILIFIKCRFINWCVIKNICSSLSVTLCGKRGSGKSSLSSALAYKKKTNSNIPLQDSRYCNVISVRDLEISDLLTRENFTDMRPGECLGLNYQKYKFFENFTIIDDAQIYYPNYEDNYLKKEYKCLPNIYCLWRHLFNSPLIFNLQKGERLWKLLRKQIEDIIEIKWTKFIFGYAVMKVIYYENLKDCEENRKPLKNHILKKSDDITIENSSRGIIRCYVLIIPKRKIRHDSYYFKKLVFNKDTFEKGAKK